MCITILQCTQRFGNTTAVLLWIKEGTYKEAPDKKRRSAVRSGRTGMFIKTKNIGRTLQDGPHICLLCGTQVNLPISRGSYEPPGR